MRIISAIYTPAGIEEYIFLEKFLSPGPGEKIAYPFLLAGRGFSILVFFLSLFPFSFLARRLGGREAVLPALIFLLFAPPWVLFTHTASAFSFIFFLTLILLTLAIQPSRSIILFPFLLSISCFSSLLNRGFSFSFYSPAVLPIRGEIDAIFSPLLISLPALSPLLAFFFILLLSPFSIYLPSSRPFKKRFTIFYLLCWAIILLSPSIHKTFSLSLSSLDLSPAFILPAISFGLALSAINNKLLRRYLLILFCVLSLISLAGSGFSPPAPIPGTLKFPDTIPQITAYICKEKALAQACHACRPFMQALETNTSEIAIFESPETTCDFIEKLYNEKEQFSLIAFMDFEFPSLLNNVPTFFLIFLDRQDIFQAFLLPGSWWRLVPHLAIIFQKTGQNRLQPPESTQKKETLEVELISSLDPSRLYLSKLTGLDTAELLITGNPAESSPVTLGHRYENGHFTGRSRYVLTAGQAFYPVFRIGKTGNKLRRLASPVSILFSNMDDRKVIYLTSTPFFFDDPLLVFLVSVLILIAAGWIFLLVLYRIATRVAGQTRQLQF